MKNSIFQTIQTFLIATFYINPKNIKLDSLFLKDLDLSQIEYLELVMVIEQKYQVNLADNDVYKCQNINDLANKVNKSLRVNSSKYL
jgi:acyl carrier protein